MTRAEPDRRSGSADALAVLNALRRRVVVLLIAVVCGGAFGVAAAVLSPSLYSSTSTVLFSLNRGQSVTELVQGTTYAQTLVQTYVQVAEAPVVLDPVIEDLDLDTTPAVLAGSIEVKAPLNTMIMNITATRASAAGSARIANAVATQLESAVTDLAPDPDDPAITVRTISPATTPTSPSSPDRLLDIATGLALGGVLGIAGVLVLEILLATASDRGSVARATSAPVLASVPRRRGSADPLAHSPTSEAFRALRTNLDFMHRPGRSLVLVVTSPAAGEGKTTTSAAIARTMGASGRRVLLVDADMRRPAIADLLGLEGAAGLSTVLTGRAELQDVLQPGPDDITVVTSGLCPPNPSELLASPEMAELLLQAGRSYDVVLLDSAPVLPVTDAAVLASRADRAIVVVNARRTSVRSLAEVALRLRAAGAPMSGVVLNCTPSVRSDYYGRRSRRWSPRRRRAGRGPDWSGPARLPSGLS